MANITALKKELEEAEKTYDELEEKVQTAFDKYIDAEFDYIALQKKIHDISLIISNIRYRILILEKK